MRTRNAHVTDRGGLPHGVTGFNYDQSQASMENSDQSQPFVGNMKEYKGVMKEYEEI